MIPKNIEDTRIKSIQPLLSPAILQAELPITHEIADLIRQTRHAATCIIQGKDDRLLMIVGPCSIHDPKAALAYAKKLKTMAHRYQKELLIIMRVYFEKPRTTVGWKGLINDPHLDNSFNINQGLRIARQLLLKINKMGIAAGTEFLDTIIPQHIGDLIAWGAIGARTTESQIHRELASGLSMPVGFKNGTTGDVQIAVDAIRAARHQHHFLGVTKEGLAAIISTQGNEACHMILRGASYTTNYDPQSIQTAIKLLQAANLPLYLMIDCSHGNSQKNHEKQIDVVASLSAQISAGNQFICGVMLESNLVAGKQNLQHGKALTYGQSVTDACLSWKQTQPLFKTLANAVKQRRQAS